MSEYKFDSVLNQDKEKKESDVNNNSDRKTIKENIQSNNSQEEKKKVKIKRTVYDENAPYDNVSVWFAWWLFWPIAGAILSYISLKNLWDKNAKYVLLWGFLITIILTYLLVFVIPETNNLKLWFLWLIFMLFQQKKVKKWAEDNPDKKYQSWFKALGWSILWWIALFLISFFTILVTTISTTNIENNISITKEYPREVTLNETFDIKFSIDNIDTKNHKLKTIDIDKSFLKGILVSKIIPKSTNEYDDIFWEHIYNFNKHLSNNLNTDIIFTVKAVKKWDFSSDVGFCIDVESNCIYDWIRILVK